MPSQKTQWGAQSSMHGSVLVSWACHMNMREMCEELTAPGGLPAVFTWVIPLSGPSTQLFWFFYIPCNWFIT